MIDSILLKQVSFLEGLIEKTGDILIQSGKIVAIAPSLPEKAELIIHEKGLHVLPGVIDPHVHFRDPGFPNKETLSTGSKAAAAGGVTSFFDMPNTHPSTTSLALLDEKKTLASKQSLVNYNFFMGATTDNLQELKKAENIPGIKIYAGSSTGSLLVNDPSYLELIFKEVPHLIAVHSESEDIMNEQKKKYEYPTIMHHEHIRSALAAKVSTTAIIALAKKYRHRTHICHLSTAEEVSLLKGLAPLITTEVTPQHLFKSSPDCYLQYGNFAKMNPPIRSSDHQKALIKGLKDGIIGCIATDHAPHTKEEKNQEFSKAPSGIPGVETSLPLLLNWAAEKQCHLADVIHWMCHQPARYFGIQNKGFLAVGYDADLVLVDLKKKKKVKPQSKCGWSIFEGETLQGWPIMTLVNGQMVFREDDFFDSVKGQEIILSSFV